MATSGLETFAATHGGAFYSGDFGKEWSFVSIDSAPIQCVAMIPDEYLVYGAAYPGEIYSAEYSLGSWYSIFNNTQYWNELNFHYNLLSAYHVLFTRVLQIKNNCISEEIYPVLNCGV